MSSKRFITIENYLFKGVIARHYRGIHSPYFSERTENCVFNSALVILKSGRSLSNRINL